MFFLYETYGSHKYSLYNCYHNNVGDGNIYNTTNIEEDLLL